MNNTENYIAIMIESLNKKIQVLDRIIELNAIQNRLLNEEKLDLDKFKENVDAKSVYVDELTKLDNGFSALYDRVKEILSTRRAVFTTEIATMKRQIALITEKSVKIQTDELRNKTLADRHFGNLKQKVTQAKKGRGVAANYYKSMNQIDYEPQFLDQKN